jgi:hypothetical protein
MPRIDVWYLVRGAADSIVHGTNMYRDTWPRSPGITDAFPYLPGTGLLLAPFRLVGLDVRHGLLLAGVFAAAGIWRLAPREQGPFLAVLTLLIPGWLALVDLSWTEPLLFVSLVAMFLAVQKGRLGLAVIALATALATKQYLLLIVPVLACWPAFGLRRAITATAAAGLVCLPWFLASPRDFLDDALFLNLNLEPRKDSLSLYSLAMDAGLRPPFFIVGVITLGAVVIACRRTATLPGVALSCAWVLAIFDLVNKQSFFNEWWLVTALVLVSIALIPAEAEPSSEQTALVKGAAAVA